MKRAELYRTRMLEIRYLHSFRIIIFVFLFHLRDKIFSAERQYLCALSALIPMVLEMYTVHRRNLWRLRCACSFAYEWYG